MSFDAASLISAIATGVGVGLTAGASVGQLRKGARLRRRMREGLELLGDLPEGAHPQLRKQLQAEIDYCAEQLTEVSRAWIIRTKAGPDRRRAILWAAASLVAGGLAGLGLPIAGVAVVALAVLLEVISRRARRSRPAEAASSKAEAPSKAAPPVA